MEINRVIFEQLAQSKGIDKSFEDFDVNNDGVISDEDINITGENQALAFEIANLLNLVDEESDLAEDANFENENIDIEKAASMENDDIVESFPPVYYPNLIKTDPSTALMLIWGLSNIDSEHIEVTKDSQERISDIMYDGVRYGIRYDTAGNIVKTIRQGFDQQGRINYQQVDDWADGAVKTQKMYEYEYDAAGNRVQKSRDAYDSQYGNYVSVMQNIFNMDVLIYDTFPTGIQKTQDGKITEMYFLGKRYCLRYDDNGKLIKSFIQEIDNEGRVTKQDITEYNTDGSVKDISKYEYDESVVVGGPVTAIQKHSVKRNEAGEIQKEVIQYWNMDGQIKSQTVKEYIRNGNLAILRTSEYTYEYDEEGNRHQKSVRISETDLPLFS